MALMRSKDVPKDAVELSEFDATTYVWEMVTEWTPVFDTWALRYAPGILGGINSLAGIMLNNHFRTRLKLGTYGSFASLVPISLMPGIFTALFHRYVVTTDLLLMKDTCPICYELKSAAIQVGLGIAYPMGLAPASALMLANRYGTYRIPSLNERKEYWEFLKKITRPLKGTLVNIMAVQLVASSILTYFEIKNNFVIRRKLLEIEKKLESQ